MTRVLTHSMLVIQRLKYIMLCTLFYVKMVIYYIYEISTNADNHKYIVIMNLDCGRWRFLSELGDE